MPRHASWIASLAWALLLVLSHSSGRAVEPAGTTDAPFPPGWTAHAPRDEIRPAFTYNPAGGPSHNGSLVITHDQRSGLDGNFQKSFPVAGGSFYQFTALRKATGVSDPRRSFLVRILWKDSTGQSVTPALPALGSDDPRPIWIAEPEHPTDGSTDSSGWTTISGAYHAPPDATQAIVELHLQWAPGGRVEYADVHLSEIPPPPPRKVRLATVHFKPSGHSSRQNCEEYAPYIAQASQQEADLVVLGETVTSVGVDANPEAIAEPIPGPTTDYFATLAKTHNLHIVLSLLERDGHLIYNSAVLLAPDGSLLGKYRKVCLPHGEVERGIAPGSDYPVFDTSFGKVGLMICYDGFFPEVARELANRGAEVIAWPVYGCNPLLAQARACENHLYIVSSTFMSPDQSWMISAVYNPAGQPIAQATEWGTIAVAEVDLSQPYIGPYNLGDFRAMIPRHRPNQPSDADESPSP